MKGVELEEGGRRKGCLEQIRGHSGVDRGTADGGYCSGEHGGLLRFFEGWYMSGRAAASRRGNFLA